jgi:microcystin-dependent protein
VVLGTTNAADPLYATSGTSAALTSAAVSPSAGGLPHENRQPSLAITYIISLFGVYPSQS